MIEAGAPRPDWKATVHGALCVPVAFQVGRATVFAGAAAAFRKTTKNESSGPISRGTIVSSPSLR